MLDRNATLYCTTPFYRDAPFYGIRYYPQYIFIKSILSIISATHLDYLSRKKRPLGISFRIDLIT